MSNYQFDVEKIKTTHPDSLLVATIILLLGVGLVTLYSASAAFAERLFGQDTFFFKKQVIFAVLGLVLMIISSRLDLELLRHWIKPLVFGTAFLCVLTFVPGIAVIKNGASRWLKIGPLSYQPSELVKFVLPVYLAHFFAKKEDRLNTFKNAVFPPAIIVCLFCFLVYLQNNFSTAVFIGANALALFFLAGIKMRHFIITIVAAVPVVSGMLFAKEYRVQRLKSFMEPEKDLLGAGYQVYASITTLTSGGLWGKGIGRGTRKIASVPEVHSDFIFAVFGEEFGFVGIFLIFGLFAFFAWRGFSIGAQAPDSFRRYLAYGLTLMISSQALFNLAVVVGAVPATGVPLPFFSAGGSSLATTMMMVGLILNVSRSKKEGEPANAI